MNARFPADFRSLALALCLFAVGAAAHATAQTEAPTAPQDAPAIQIAFQKSSVVCGAEYTLGDVAEIRATEPDEGRRLAMVVLGKSPALGVRARLNERSLTTTLDALGIADEANVAFPDRMFLMREVQALDPDALAEAIKEKLLDTVQADPKRIVVSQMRLPRSVRLPAGAISYEIELRLPRRGAGTVSFTVEVRVDGACERRLTGSFYMDQLVDALRVEESLNQGESITSETVVPAQARLSQLRGRPLTPETLESDLSATRDLEPGDTLTDALVEREVLIRRGQTVRMVLDRGAMHISALGKARSDGARGDPIEVENQTSRKRIQAIVVDRQTVSVP